jgi:serine phosphatase RsbU (regulator of sigma subunit)
MDQAGNQFGEEALLKAIGRGQQEPLEASVAGVLADIAEWHGAARQQDDISVLAVECSIA